MTATPQEGTPQSGTFTSSTAQNAAVAILALGYQTALVTLQNVGSITGGAIAFEGFDGNAWYTLTAIEVPGGANDTTYALAGGSLSWYVDITAYGQFRVRLSTTITGTGSCLVTVRGSSANSPNTRISSSTSESSVNLNEVGGALFGLGQTAMAGSLPVTLASNNTGPVEVWDGTNTANVVAGDNGFNGLATAGAGKLYSFTTSTPGAQDLLADTPIEGYAWVTVFATSVGSGLSWAGQFSPTAGSNYVTGTTWANVTAFGQGSANLGTSVSTFYQSPTKGLYFKLRVTALTSGTLSGYVYLSNTPQQLLTTSVSTQSGTWSVGANSATGSTVPANAFYMGGSDGTNLVGVKTTSAGDTQASGILGTGGYIWNGASNDRLRTPVIFKTISATASGNTAVWTPTAGKKFRLMKFKVQVTSNAATSGGAIISVGFQDSTTDIGVTNDAFVPSTAITTGAPPILDSGWIDLGNGKLSASANNVLNVNLSAALTSGGVRVIVCGTEE